MGKQVAPPRQNPDNSLVFDVRWINEKIDHDCITFLEKMGEYLCDLNAENRVGFNAVTTSQLRNVFEEVKSIQLRAEAEKDKDFSKIETDILLLRPKIAYNAARVISKNNSSRMKKFKEFAEKALIQVTLPSTDQNGKDTRIDKYLRFVKLMEGVIAYHKVYGGKD